MRTVAVGAPLAARIHMQAWPSRYSKEKGKWCQTLCILMVNRVSLQVLVGTNSTEGEDGFDRIGYTDYGVVGSYSSIATHILYMHIYAICIERGNDCLAL